MISTNNCWYQQFELLISRNRWNCWDQKLFININNSKDFLTSRNDLLISGNELLIWRNDLLILTINNLYIVFLISKINYRYQQFGLEQLERLRSEDTPAAPWLPILLTSSFWIPSQYYWPVHIGSRVKRRWKPKKLEKLAKNLNFRLLL